MRSRVSRSSLGMMALSTLLVACSSSSRSRSLDGGDDDGETVQLDVSNDDLPSTDAPPEDTSAEDVPAEDALVADTPPEETPADSSSDPDSSGEPDALSLPLYEESIDCDPLADDGCDPDLKCSINVLNDAPWELVRTCVPTGSLAVGDPCERGEPGGATGFDDCETGSYCSDGTCQRLCSFDGNNHCSGAEVCVQHFGVFEDLDIGVCEDLCDVLEPTCGEEEGCFVALYGGAHCNVPDGGPTGDDAPGRQGDRCFYNNGCEPGYSCVGRPEGVGTECAYICDAWDLGGPGCDDELVGADYDCFPIAEFYGDSVNVFPRIGMCVSCEDVPEACSGFEDQINCHPLTGDRCEEGFKCAMNRLDELTSVRTCVPNGEVPVGEACERGEPGAETGYDDCEAGSHCLKGVCAPVCAGGDDCTEEQTCALYAGVFRDLDLGLCEQPCDVLSPACDEGEGCFLNSSSKEATCGVPLNGDGEPAGQDEPCRFTNSCKIGYGCVSISLDNMTPTCAFMCNASGGTPACEDEFAPDAYVCVALNDFYVDGDFDPDIGLCVSCSLIPEACE